MEDALQRIVAMATLLNEQKSAVAALEEALSEAKQNLHRTQREDLPELMKELGLQEIKLRDGSTVEVKNELDIAIPAANRDATYAWMVDNGYGGLIRSECKITFTASERARALACYEDLATRRYPVTYDEKIPPQTLKAWAKERIAAGDELPAEMFRLNPYDWAKIDGPK